MTKMKKDNDIEIILKPYSQNIHVLNKNYWVEKNLGFAFDDTSDFKIYNLDENEFKHANNFKNSITNDIYPYPEFTKDELNGINFDLAERFKDIDIDLD